MIFLGLQPEVCLEFNGVELVRGARPPRALPVGALADWLVGGGPALIRENTARFSARAPRTAGGAPALPISGFMNNGWTHHLVIVSFKLSKTFATAVIAASSALSIDTGIFDSPTASRLSAALVSERKLASCCS